MTNASQTAATASPAADPLEQAYPELSEFWTAARQGRLLLRSCTGCGRPHAYPRMICPFCRSQALRWVESAGRGVVHSYSVMRRVETPYVLAYVRLDEGAVMMSNIVDCDVDDVSIGQRVELVWRDTPEGRPVPFFKPAA